MRSEQLAIGTAVELPVGLTILAPHVEAGKAVIEAGRHRGRREQAAQRKREPGNLAGVGHIRNLLSRWRRADALGPGVGVASTRGGWLVPF